MTTAILPHLPLLRDALSEALLASWQDIVPETDKGLIHIEYESKRGQPIDWIRVLSSTRWGSWNLVCSYSMHNQPFGEAGLRFGPGYHSAGLSEALERIMQHQQTFSPPEITNHGLIQVSLPEGT